MKLTREASEFHGPDPLHQSKWCKQPYYCPSCLWRRLLGFSTDQPGPAYQLAWAIQQGVCLSAFQLLIEGADFGYAHEAARELSKRLRGTVKPDA